MKILENKKNNISVKKGTIGKFVFIEHSVIGVND